MISPSSDGQAERRPFASGAIGAVLAAIVLVLTGYSRPASAGALSPGDMQCVACHSMPGLTKSLESGEKLSLQIPTDAFQKSVHAPLGCTMCHSDVKLPAHPGSVGPIKSRSDFSAQMVQVCGNCHKDQSREWNTSVHAALSREGNPIAPVCTTCHSPHSVMKGAAESMDTIPCKGCHAAVFTAYAGSVHGQLRSSGVMQAPLCFGCHGAHGVAVPSAGSGRKDACFSCHKEAAGTHRTWLPNADLHFNAISCPVCHAPKAQRRVDLVLFNDATQKEVPQPTGVPAFSGAPTAGTGGLDANSLLAVLKALNPPGSTGKTALKGRLEVSTGVEAHQLVPASGAISDCKVCHQAGANAFQSVVLSVAGPAGIPIHYGADKDVLKSAVSLQSVGGFYAIGGTRITVLDGLFILAVLGGFGGPAAHFTLRMFFRRFRNGKANDQAKGH